MIGWAGALGAMDFCKRFFFPPSQARLNEKMCHQLLTDQPIWVRDPYIGWYDDGEITAAKPRNPDVVEIQKTLLVMNISANILLKIQLRNPNQDPGGSSFD